VGDQAADGFLQGILAGRYPDDGVLSEETAGDGRRLSKSRVWMVDPLDGTKEFGERRADWAVHVGLALDGAPLLGAVALPATGEVLYGSPEGVGLEGGTRELVRGDSAQAARPVLAVSRSHTPEWVSKLAGALGGEMRPFGSVGYKVSRLVFGEADLYVHQKGLKEWDTCAPEAVAGALGWSVTTLSGAEHRYNRANPRNEQILVCRPSFLPRLLDTLGSLGVTR
jgi:3'(2'), 5'-bisphosphate nucleotidase